MVDARWQAIIASLRLLHSAGIAMVAGTDQGIPGYSLHRELEVYVEAGFTPLEPCRRRRFRLPARLELRRNRVRWKSGSVAMCCCSMPIHSRIFTTPAQYGGRFRKEQCTIPCRSGRLWGSCLNRKAGQTPITGGESYEDATRKAIGLKKVVGGAP